MTNLLESCKKLSVKNYTYISCAFLAIFSPGYLLLYLYKPSLFQELETAKLFAFAISLTAPVVFINLMLVNDLFNRVIKYDETVFQDDRAKREFMMSCVITCVFLHGLIIAAYYWGFSFKVFIIIVAVIEMVGVTTVENIARLKEKREKVKKQTSD